MLVQHLNKIYNLKIFKDKEICKDILKHTVYYYTALLQ